MEGRITFDSNGFTGSFIAPGGITGYFILARPDGDVAAVITRDDVVGKMEREGGTDTYVITLEGGGTFKATGMRNRHHHLTPSSGSSEMGPAGC